MQFFFNSVVFNKYLENDLHTRVLLLLGVCVGVFLLRFILYGTPSVSWSWLAISLSMLGKFLTIISSKIFSYHLLYSSFSGKPIIGILTHLILSQRSLRLPSVIFICFTLFCSSEAFSTLLSSSSLIRSSAANILLIPSKVF